MSGLPLPGRPSLGSEAGADGPGGGDCRGGSAGGGGPAAGAGPSPFGTGNDGVEAVIDQQMVDALPRREDAHATAADQLGVPDADADQLAAGQEQAAAGPALLGGRAVMKKSRSSRLSLSSNQRTSTSRLDQLESRVPRSMPIEVTIESMAGSRRGAASRAT